jgi:glycosyltransferase involved in cell wall biosynthesis
MNILYIISGLGMGGAENILSSLGDGLISRGHNVKIICLKGDVVVKPVSEKIDIISLNLNSLGDIFFRSKSIKKIIEEFSPDVVHAHMFHAIVLARILRITIPMKKLICTAHSKSFGGKLRALIYKITDRWSDVNTNVSFEATENFIQNNIFRGNNSLTITNGVDVTKFVPNHIDRASYREKFKIFDHEKIFIAVGRFSDAKDYPNLINAFNLFIANDVSNSKLFIVGDGELRTVIESLIIENGLSDRITLLGIRHDIPNLLNMSDFFILSSAWEGLPTVLLEAMATEKIVIATDCGGSNEIINNGEFLVPIKNSQLLMERMKSVVDLNQEESRKIGKINRQRVVDHYSLDAMVEKWLKIYQEK